jgi:hypothetical protein
MHDRKHNRNADEARAREQDHVPEPHDRKHGLGSHAGADDHDGERKPWLSARSLAARGEAPDGSEDGLPAEDDAEGTGGEA